MRTKFGENEKFTRVSGFLSVENLKRLIAIKKETKTPIYTTIDNILTEYFKFN